MDRHQLDSFTTRHSLSPGAVAAALELTDNRPTACEWHAFMSRLCHGAGLGAVGAGVIFFVAANWQDYGVFGRFALLETALLLCILGALWRPPPQRIGRSALLLATLAVGALLALFGQTYQTGADLYELFFTWALLTLPFAVAGFSGALWALWWCVLNTALLLVCGGLGVDDFFWRLLGGANVSRAELLMLPCIVNLVAAAIFLRVGKGRWATAAPAWLWRMLAIFAFAYGTTASIAAILGTSGTAARTGHLGVVGAFAVVSVVVGAITLQSRRDVFPVALLAASWIAISTSWSVKTLNIDGAGELLLIALWLIGTSTAAGWLMLHWSRAWHVEAGSPRGLAA